VEPINHHDTSYFLSVEEKINQRFLCIEGDTAGFQGEFRDGIYKCPLTNENAAVLRERLPWLKPQPLGLVTSFGFGDRLGLATPGHIAAVTSTGISPIFAQQSVRENNRTRRTPQIVLDDAMWAIFEMDWREPWGADADHVKEIGDLPPFIDAGYSFYTIDPNEYVDNEGQTDTIHMLKAKTNHIPWDQLQVDLDGLYRLYVENQFDLNGSHLIFQEDILLRALVKYGRAIAHIKSISDYLKENVHKFDLEASIDETDTPTSAEEHYFIANELRRLEVPFVSLAPRFIGSFEKGVDYVSLAGKLDDLAEFDSQLEKHAEVMHAIGGYKLSIHTGSDKFSIYPSIAEKTQNLVHVKTAGTSYLEALRVIATVDQHLFREIFDFSRDRYEIDKATYHVSGKLEKVPAAADLADTDLLALFNHFDTRQVLHVTFGSIMDVYLNHLIGTLRDNQILYNQFLENHFMRHLSPFMA
jgi:hypothetical protein